MNTKSQNLNKADSRLRKAFEQAEPDETLQVVMILEPQNGNTSGSSKPPIPSEFNSREEFRLAITAHREAVLAQQLGPTLQALRERGLEVHGGRLGRLAAVKGRASALLESLDIPGVSQALLDHPIVIEVSASQEWTRTGIKLKVGQRVRLEASGTVDMAGSDDESQPFFHTVPPEGRTTLLAYMPYPLMPPLGLVAKVGDNGQVFFIGNTKEWTSDAQGELLLGVNDHLHVDNSGSWRVRAFLDVEAPVPVPRRWVKTQKKIYAVGEPVTIQFCDDCYSSNSHAFVALATPSSRPDEWIWDGGYLGAKSGKREYRGELEARDYEARAYDYRERNKPGDVATAKYAFSVQVNAEGFHLRTKEEFAVNEQIEVEFVDPSGGLVIYRVAVAEKLALASGYIEYKLTESKNCGTLKFNALPPGEYQVRGFSKGNRMSVYKDFAVKAMSNGAL